MAGCKLPPSLFSAKARAPQSGCSKSYLHFIAHYVSVDVSAHRNVSTITTRDRTTGKVYSKTLVGRPLTPSDFEGKK